MSRRIGILGGTFDPIHCGHIDLAAAASTALGLTSVWFVPANVPPHRHTTSASGFHRFAMVALAVSGRQTWQACDLELGHSGPSYTSATLRHLHEQGFAPTELYFVIGADAFREIATWRHYPDLLEDAHFAVVSRPGRPVDALQQALPVLAPRMVAPREAVQARTPSIFLIDAPTADVSSSEIRRRLALGHPIAGLVPPAVDQHIEQHGLYASGAAKTETAARSATS
jgi:nicotinate-nucleotide adenylyltransferase